MLHGLALSRKPGGLLILLMLFTFVSCDPMQSLTIENKTDREATITFVFNKGDRYYKFNEPSGSDTLMVQLDTTSEHIRQAFYFGLGTWEIQSSLDSLISAVESIEVETWRSKETFKGEQQIRAFFESGLTGRKKAVIEIILN